MRRDFVKLVLTLFAVFFTLFSAEFLLEWVRLGRPLGAAMSFAGVGGNAKLVDLLSPVARAYNNILAMLLATIGIAIPLTANMHTPKLIEMFLRDRLNQAVLGFGAFSAANVIFVDYLIGPAFTPIWAIRVTVLGVLVGWTLLIPYFFYVMRFVDPSNILLRLQQRALAAVDGVGRGHLSPEAGREAARQSCEQIGTLILKSLDRADRGVAVEGIWGIKQLLDGYQARKGRLPPGWFRVERRDFVGLSQEAIDFINADRTVLEMMALGQLRVAFRQALAKAPDLVSTIADAVRKITVAEAARGDEPALRLAARHFNNLLRETIRARAPLAFYEVLHEYRRLADEVPDRPELALVIARRVAGYADEARRAGMPGVAELAAFDLAHIAERALAAGSPRADEVLEVALAPLEAGAATSLPVVKARLLLGGWLVQEGREEAAARVERALAGVPAALLVRAEVELLAAEPAFFEVTDRQATLDYVPPERRAALRQLVERLVARAT